MKGNWQLEYGAQAFRITWDLIIRECVNKTVKGVEGGKSIWGKIQLSEEEKAHWEEGRGNLLDV